MEPELCLRMLKKLSEKIRAKFPATTRGYFMVKIPRLDDAFSEFFEFEASPVGLSLQQKENYRRFLCTPENKCRKTRFSWKERHTARERGYSLI